MPLAKKGAMDRLCAKRGALARNNTNKRERRHERPEIYVRLGLGAIERD